MGGAADGVTGGAEGVAAAGTAGGLLDVRGLTVGFMRADTLETANAVEDVSFTLGRGETLCLVGESGCGKSVTALSLPRLLPSPPAVPAKGSVLFDGDDLLRLPESALRRIRGGRIGMIFQDPMTSLNPVLRVGDQMAEALRLHKRCSAREAADAAVAMLERVDIPDAAERARDFPHRLSGGMRQRVMIGMALMCSPDLIVADEPTTALDVTVQKRILSLMRELITGSQSALLLITHDLGVAAQAADRVAVMYAGKIVEQGSARAVLAAPGHPYAEGLLRSRPALAAGAEGSPRGRKERLFAIPGTVPGLWSRPAGCAFHPRCPYRFSRCETEAPPLFSMPDSAGTARLARCWLREA